ncbi:MAG: protein kinase [Planctomycetes bacterium]|nr:protein kinase [Planctomycetota bacterium]
MTVPGQPVAPERVPIADRFDLPAGVAVAFSGEPCRASERATGETVGIQRLAPEFAAGAADLERVRALLHPNLVRVRALLSDDAGPYFVIEWPERGTLAERRAAGPLSKARLFAVARDVSRALSCLHEAGMACADLGARCILETERGTFKLSGYGAPQGGGDEATAVLPAGARSLAGADRFRLDLASFAALIEDLCEDVPASLRPVLERCRPGSPAAFGGAAELGRALADLPEAKVLPEVVEAESAAPRAASARPAAALGASPPGAADAATGRFPWRPVGDLYRLEGDAMDGGMGSVRMATEIATGRKVAVKRLLLQSGLDASVLERFRREANSIARLSHPHILQLLQPARDEQGDYLVLEWAAGGSLRERLNREGALPAAEVIDIARKIGGALAYAHKKGVIHRDVKPHDFGLARSAGDLTLSTSRAGAGSPLYMPPEQFDASRSADARSDVYSLGKTLYHLVTNASPAVPEARLIPAELRRPLMRCMEADPAKRPASVEEFLAELTEVKRRPLWPVLAAVLVVALAAGLAVQQFLRRGAERPAPPSGSGEAVGQPAGREAAKTAPRVLLAGFFTGGGDQELQNGDKVEAESVDVRLRFEPPPAAEERPAVVVRRGGEELAAEEWSASWQEDGLLVLTVPLAGRDNELVVEVPSLEFQSAPREVVRFDPEPMLKSVSDAEDLGQGRHITAREQVELTFEVARGKGIRTLWLAQNDVKQAVELQQDGTVRHQARLTEGKNEFLWYWPDEASRVSAGEQVVVADFSAPAVEVHQPEDGFLTNGAVLHVDGRVVDANCGKEATWRLLCGGAEKARGAPALEPNGNFQADAVLPSDVEGELVLEVSAADQVSRLSEPVRVVVRADRTAPLLARPPEFAPAFGEGRVLAAVTLRGLATEPLKSATVNGVPARLDGAGDAFEKAGLEAREGEAYEIVLTDRAGNASQPLRFAHGVDTEPPQAELSFAERDGALLLLVRPKERLKVLEVDGAALAAEALAAPEIAAPVSGTLAERTTYKGVPGPTLNPIKVRMLDLTENETVLWLVVCPEDKETAVVCRMKDGQAAGTEPCSRCNGQYCPRTGAGGPHKPVSETDLRPVDYWVKSGHGQCEYCGWPKK